MGWKKFKSGKVRESMIDGERIIHIASDRISANDKVLDSLIPDKGKILTKMSAFWSTQTQDIVPNAFITCNNALMDWRPFQSEEMLGRCTMQKFLNMVPVEIIVRRHFTGSMRIKYLEGEREFCGYTLPEGLQEAAELPEYMFTPTTKSDEHDENLTYQEMITCIRDSGFSHAKDLAALIRYEAINLFDYAYHYAKGRGIIIADAKFEFGLDRNGSLCLGDELLTPDSARFWPTENFEIGRSQSSFDKQLVRDWLKAHPGETVLPDGIIAQTRQRYITAYERLTGQKFE